MEKKLKKTVKAKKEPKKLQKLAQMAKEPKFKCKYCGRKDFKKKYGLTQHEEKYCKKRPDAVQKKRTVVRKADDPVERIEVGEIVEFEFKKIFELEKKMGRPTKRLTQTIADLAMQLTFGRTVVEACDYARISRSTYYQWCKTDEDFSYKMLKAQFALENVCLKTVIEDIKRGNGRLALEFLKARYPEKYGNTLKIKPMEGEAIPWTDEDKETIVRMLEGGDNDEILEIPEWA